MNTKTDITKEIKAALIAYLSGELSPDYYKLLDEWIQKAEENKRLFDQINDLWQATSGLGEKAGFDANAAWNEIYDQINKKPKSTRVIIRISSELSRIAAVFIFALVIGGLGYYLLDKKPENNLAPQYVEYVSPLGSRSFVKLADGSKVWLNAGSTLKYQNSFGENNRDLILSGEAFFEVAKNKNLPFVVKTSEIDIVALGTKFNVKAYAEENSIETTLIEGSVKLESSIVKLSDNIILNPNEKAVFFKKNQSVKLITQQQQQRQKTEAVSTGTKPRLEIITSVDPEPIISWKEKRWIINNEKLSSLAVKLERRFDVNLIFDNELIKEYSFGGTLEDETLKQIMEAIRFSSPIKYVIDNKTVYIMADGQEFEKFKNLLMK